MHKFDLAAILSTLVGVSSLAADASFQPAVAALLGPHAPHAIAILSIVGLVGGQVLRVIGAPSATVLEAHSGIIAPTTPPETK